MYWHSEFRADMFPTTSGGKVQQFKIGVCNVSFESKIAVDVVGDFDVKNAELFFDGPVRVRSRRNSG
jgi:hypothetical protein